MTKMQKIVLGITSDLIFLAIMWTITFAGSIAIGGLASIVTQISLVDDAILTANYVAGILALVLIVTNVIGIEVSTERISQEDSDK